MRILLTGVSGQVGSALRAPLASLGEVVATDRSCLDLSRPETIAHFLETQKPDLIINPAAYTAVDQAEDERALAYRVNAEAPLAMARWAADHDVPMLHFSTDYVFDGSGNRPWRESDPTNPASVYGASKEAGEEAIRAVNGCHLIVRTSWVYASTGKNFLNTIIRLAREQTELRIVADQIGAPTSARSIAAGTISLLTKQQGTPSLSGLALVRNRFSEAGGLLHLCASGETSWHGFASAIVDQLRERGEQLAAKDIVAIQTKDFPTKAQRPRNSRLSMDRLHGLIGLKMPDWRDSLRNEFGT